MREAGVMRLPEGAAESFVKQKQEGSDKRTRQPRGSAAHGRLASQVLDHLLLAVLVIDDSLRLQYWNLRAAGLFGIALPAADELPSLEAVLGGSGCITPRQRERVTDFCSGIITASERAQPATWLRLSLGRRQRVAFTLKPLSRQRWLLVVEEHQSIAEPGPQSRDAMIDALTGLSNRRHFNETLRDVVQQAGPGTHLAVLIVNLDRFRSINETLGQAVGDALLGLVAQRLRRQTREEDMVARFGGDEYAILLSDGQTAERLADRIMDVLSRPFLVEGNVVNIGVSIGVAHYLDYGGSAEDLIHHADLALYEAKSAGRGTWRNFEPALADHADARRALETDLRKALSLAELSLDYQPRFDARSRCPTGFVAMLRWNHPSRGTVSPAVFIPLAEDIGCMEELGEWVMRTACHQPARWTDPLPVVVNISPLQLGSCDRLYQVIEAALAKSGLPPARLEIDVIASSLFVRDPAVLDFAHRVRSLGVGLSMGNPSNPPLPLDELLQVRLDSTIKAELSTVADADPDGSAAQVVRAITETVSVATGAAQQMQSKKHEQEAPMAVDRSSDGRNDQLVRPYPAGDLDGDFRTFPDGSGAL